MLNDGEVDLGRKFYLKRINKNEWAKIDENGIQNVKSFVPFLSGNAVVVGIFENNNEAD
jgi:hypothetical protein